MAPTIEASTGYHRFVLELLLYSFILCRENKIEIDKKYWRKLHQMLVYVKAYLRPDGFAPLIGDTDGGQVLPFSITAQTITPTCWRSAPKSSTIRHLKFPERIVQSISRRRHLHHAQRRLLPVFQRERRGHQRARLAWTQRRVEHRNLRTRPRIHRRSRHLRLHRRSRKCVTRFAPPLITRP